MTCPICRHEFDFRYYAFGFSSSSKRPALSGLIGGLIGFSAVEVLDQTNVFVPTDTSSLLLYAMLMFGLFGACLGASMGVADGLMGKKKGRLLYGLIIGAVLGLVSGCISGPIAQYTYSTILGSGSTEIDLPVARVMFVRTLGWGILGLLIGASYGIKENTTGDVKYGLIGGSIGGVIGGLLFDPLTELVQFGGGTIGRLVAFTVLGIAISVAINHLQEGAIRRDSPDMYKPLIKKLPANPRLALPTSRTNIKQYWHFAEKLSHRQL